MQGIIIASRLKPCILSFMFYFLKFPSGFPLFFEKSSVFPKPFEPVSKNVQDPEMQISFCTSAKIELHYISRDYIAQNSEGWQ